MRIFIALASNPQKHILIAADSIEKLRSPDVFRVLDTAGRDAKEVAHYIIKHRPDLEDEVRSVMVEELGINL